LLGLVACLGGSSGFSASHAATYYVAPSGSGSGGSTASPRAAPLVLDVAKDGDVVVFLDGTYPGLTLKRSSDGTGVITLRAYRPILNGISFDSGAVSGLRSTGAVVAGGRLYVRGLDGVVVEGLKFTTADQGIALVNVKNAKVRRNHFHENSLLGVAASGTSDNIRILSNYFTNYLDADPGSHMDYGLFADNTGTLDVANNLVDGRFNQAMSVKKSVTYARFSRNVFRAARGSNLMLGQSSDTDTIDRTAGRADVIDNRFENNQYTSIYTSNVEDVLISGNTFRNVARVITSRYDLSTSPGYTIGRLPASIEFSNNVIDNASYAFFEGRGDPSELVVARDNVVPTPLRNSCRILPMSTANDVTGEPYSGYPTFEQSNNGSLYCRRW
jgi:Right handed beta helix region